MPTGCGLPVSSSSAMMMMMTVMVVVLHRHRYPYSHIVITWQSIDHVPGRLQRMLNTAQPILARICPGWEWNEIRFFVCNPARFIPAGTV